jgi:hypothetical protein
VPSPFTVALAASALAAPAPPAASVQPYWQEKGCHQHYRSAVAYRRIRQTLRTTWPLPNGARAKIGRWSTCLASRQKAHHAHQRARGWHRWRRSYGPSWAIRFHSLPAYAQQWAVSTGGCESGNDPTTNTGNGYYGSMQWTMHTWYSAGGDRPPTSASREHRWVLSWNWHVGHPSGQWPVCGE